MRLEGNTREVVSVSFKGMISGGRELIKRAAAGVSLTCLLVIAYACSSHDASADAELRAQGAAAPSKIVATARVPGGGLSLNLVNFTGSTLRAVYVSPSVSKGWEEDVLGGDELNDGNAVDIRFSPEQGAALWDIKVESADGHCAEWKGLDLRGASRITLLLSLVGEPVAVAEVE
jgi:hypothetical protein